MTAERSRIQLTIHLGEGSSGEELRQALEHAASACGETVSAWARRILYTAAGLPDETPVTRRDLAELERRVHELELRKSLQTVLLHGKLVTRAPDCSGCMFPHALCGPCTRWNGR